LWRDKGRAARPNRRRTANMAYDVHRAGVAIRSHGPAM
jgi:hypothetical protein